MSDKINKIKRAIGQVFKKDISNEYIDWLCFANPGMLNRGNLYCIDHAIRNLPSDHPILEIGSFCGLSTNIITYYLDKHNKKNQVYTCDKWEFENKGAPTSHLGDSRIAHKDYREFVKSSYMRNIEFFSGNRKPFTIEVFSDEFFELWKEQKVMTDVFGRETKLGGKFSFAFIDGNHTYEFAKRDFENTDRNLDVGGFILFDDSLDGNIFGLSSLMKEISQMDSYELVIKNPNYLFKKIK